MTNFPIPAPAVIAIVGLPGSGKSTVAKQYQADKPGTVAVSMDDLRHLKGLYTPENEKFVRLAWETLIVMAIKSGVDVVVHDAGLLEARKLENLRKLATSNGATFIVDSSCLDVSIDECIRRDQVRPYGVGEAVIRKMHGRNIGFQPRYQDPALPHCVILDIDDCASFKHPDREVFDWSQAHLDIVNQPIWSIMSGLPEDTRVVVLTGRMEIDGGREILKNWLDANSFDYDEIHMRQEGDRRGAGVYKKEVIDALLARYNIDFAIEDDPEVIAVYEKLCISTIKPTFVRG
jgi:predicted kinase